MRRTNGGSGNTVPLRIIPERVEILKDQGKPARAKGWNVFRNDPFRANRSDDTSKLSPKTGAIAEDSGSLSGCGDVLAGKASADDIDSLKFVSDEGHIFVACDVGPMFCKNRATKRIDFNLPPNLVTRALKAQIKPPDPAEETSYFHRDGTSMTPRDPAA